MAVGNKVSTYERIFERSVVVAKILTNLPHYIIFFFTSETGFLIELLFPYDQYRRTSLILLTNVKVKLIEIEW